MYNMIGVENYLRLNKMTDFLDHTNNKEQLFDWLEVIYIIYK